MYCLTPKCASSNWKRLATAIRMNWTFEELEERKKDIYHAVPSLFDLQKRKEKIQMEDSGIKHAQVCSMFFHFLLRTSKKHLKTPIYGILLTRHPFTRL